MAAPVTIELSGASAPLGASGTNACGANVACIAWELAATAGAPNYDRAGEVCRVTMGMPANCADILLFEWNKAWKQATYIADPAAKVATTQVFKPITDYANKPQDDYEAPAAIQDTDPGWLYPALGGGAALALLALFFAFKR